MNSDFAKHVDFGLSKKEKAISSRYFYDAKGDKIFQQIMNMPEYYPTKCEFEIFNSQKEAILQTLPKDQSFNLVELGAGDGYKTKVLLNHFIQSKVKFTYYPVDISADVLKHLKNDLNQNLPELEVQPLNQEYFKALEELNKLDHSPKVILFLGGNIGNFHLNEAETFMKELADKLNIGDRLLTGIDLKKNPDVILNAYNDVTGITASFNMNLLERMNRELDAEFDMDKFFHFPSYNPVTGECQSYIISREPQEVYIKALNKSFQFDSYEAIHTEVSKKYSLRGIEKLAEKCGFTIEKHFLDQKQYFANSVWIKA